MALTITPIEGTEFTIGRMRGLCADVTFDNAYLTTGEVFSPDDFGLLQIIGANCIAVRTAAGAAATTYFLPIYNPITGTLQVYECNANEGSMLEVDNGEDPSANTYTMLVIGFQ